MPERKVLQGQPELQEQQEKKGQPAQQALQVQLERLEQLPPEELPQVQSGLAKARGLVEQSIVEIRRLLADLSPAVLEQLGLAAALRQLVNRLRRLPHIRVKLEMAELGPLPKKIESVVYRLVQECCNNIARHASASHVNISLRSADGVVRLRVRDDGVGFKVEETLARGDSLGLAGLRERVALLEGHCKLESRPGKGTTISIQLPIPAPEQPRAETAQAAGNGLEPPAPGGLRETKGYAEDPNCIGR